MFRVKDGKIIARNLQGKVVLTYTVESIPTPGPSEVELLTARVGRLEDEMVKKEVITETEKEAIRDPKDEPAIKG